MLVCEVLLRWVRRGTFSKRLFDGGVLYTLWKCSSVVGDSIFFCVSLKPRLRSSLGHCFVVVVVVVFRWCNKNSFALGTAVISR